LPPGLTLDVEPPPVPTVGRGPTGSCETVLPPVPELVVEVDVDVDVDVDVVIGAVLPLAGIEMLTDGSRVRPVAPAVTVSCTEVSEVALAGTAIWPMTWRAADPE
jgi:hypothetical protein